MYMRQHSPQPQYSQNPPQPQYSHQPQYSQPPQYSAQPQPLPGYATSPDPSYGQPAASSRLLHIYREGFTQRHVRIVDSDKQTPLYNIDMNSGGLFSSKPHVKINAATGNQVGTITFHMMSSDMDLTIHNQSMLLKKAGFLSSAHEFNSVATGGSFKWKKDGFFSGGDMLCLDQREQMVARFQHSGWAMKKEGKFELSPGVSGILMDEIVTSGVAMVEYLRRQRASSAGAAGAAGGGGVAAC